MPEAPATATTIASNPRVIWPLQSLNFFMADLQAGIGPFLGVFLIAHHWGSGPIGTVMTLGGVAGMVMTAPFGAMVDATRHKRVFVVIPGLCAIGAALLILLSQSFWVVTLSQVASAVAGAAIGPAVAAMTLGIVRQAGFPRQNGRNQAFNHAGNMVGAALSGFLGWRFGFDAVLWLAALFGGLSILSALAVPPEAIDHQAARGMREGDTQEETASGFRVLVQTKPLLILAGALGCFHLGNGAMLPLLSMALVAHHTVAAPLLTVAETVVVAQGVMIVASLWATRMAGTRGYWIIMLITFVALPIRGIVAASIASPWGIYPVQVLDGIGAGLQSVAVPGLVARILNGTGRVNVGQGAVMTVQGLGASLSPALGGWIAQLVGYHLMFLILGSFALVSLALWLGFHQTLRPACDTAAEPT
jgi:predicted MFS family arabinose efflux permease